MRVWFVAFAVAAEFPLMAAHQIFPDMAFLPLGGSEWIQHMILISTGFSFAEISAFATESLRTFIRIIRRIGKGKDNDR